MIELNDKELRDRIDRFLIRLKTFLSSETYGFSSIKPSDVPDEPGVYLIREVGNGNSIVVYIGQTSNLQRRLLANHRSGNRRASTFRRKLSSTGILKQKQE